MPPKYDQSLSCFLPSSPERHFLFLFELPCSVGDNDLTSTNYTVANILINKGNKNVPGSAYASTSRQLAEKFSLVKPINTFIPLLSTYNMRLYTGCNEIFSPALCVISAPGEGYKLFQGKGH